MLGGLYRQDAVAVAIPSLPATQGHGEPEGEEAAAGLRVEEKMVREELVGGLQAVAGRDDAIQVPVNPHAGDIAGSGGIAQDLGGAEEMPRTRATSALSPVGTDTRTPHANGVS